MSQVVFKFPKIKKNKTFFGQNMKSFVSLLHTETVKIYMYNQPIQNVLNTSTTRQKSKHLMGVNPVNFFGIHMLTILKATTEV